MLRTVSVIVPTWNEEDNIEPLVERIHRVLQRKGIIYEIIFIDDYSVDYTQENIRRLSYLYPITLYMKKGKKGKAQSLLEGFAYAKYDTITMIDADLQYPPEAIPEMLAKIHTGYDIVVGNRKENSVNLIRRFVSKTFHIVFTRLLHGLRVDAQSGLKVFKTEILHEITFNNPPPWAFDLEFLVQAKQLNLNIGGIDIVFEKRHTGKSKISVLNASYQIGLSAVKLKFSKQKTKLAKKKQAVNIIHPLDLSIAIEEVSNNQAFGTQKNRTVNSSEHLSKSFTYKGKTYAHYTALNRDETALYRLTKKQMQGLCIVLCFVGISMLLNWHATLVGIIALLTSLYFIDLLFNLFLIIRSFSRRPDIRISTKEIAIVNTLEWPSYTIFCPLYKEWQVVPQFITAMADIEYPKEKLQIMLLLEEDDKQTIAKVQTFDLPQNFEVHIVPHGLPKTKPKALNYGLQYATGEYCVIYDAEDMPDCLQLKKTVLAFRKVHPGVICIQAKLNFYNPYQNLLTRLFTSEYSLWFDLILTGLQSIGATIPLGGTSNHFRTKDLRTLHGWDAFNVTEDCDLGVRLVKKGYKTAILDSVTLEEANSDIKNWFTQRSRWIKGYIQTYLVHMRNLKSFQHKLTTPHFVTFQLVVGGKILSMFINPVMWCITIIYFAFRSHVGLFIESFFPGVILYMGVFSLVFGNFLYFYYYMMGCAKREQYDLIKYTFFIPFYWLCMSIAAWIAVYEIVYKPFYWSKTTHGLHLKKEEEKRRQIPNLFNPFRPAIAT